MKKMDKKKLAVVSLVLCIVAVLSLGSLAYFTDTDTVTNTLKFANAGDDTVDFGLDLFETDPDTGLKTDTGVTYTNLLPGKKISKNPTVINDGKYNEYVRVSVTLNKYDVWSTIVAEGTDLTTIFGGFDSSKWTLAGTPVVNGTEITYTYYYNSVLAPYNDTLDNRAVLFTDVTIPSGLTTAQANLLKGEFTIKVEAEAIQSDALPTGVNTPAAAFALLTPAAD